MAALNGKIYAIAGERKTIVDDLNVVEVYDPNSNIWTTAAPLPSVRAGAGAATVNGKIYVIACQSNGIATIEVDVYDPALDTWTSAAPVPSAGTSVAVALNGKIFAIGGAQQLNIFDPSSSTWSTGAPMPISSLPDFVIAAAAGKVYVLGGTAPSPNSVSTNFVQVYDPNTNTWNSAATMPTSH